MRKVSLLCGDRFGRGPLASLAAFGLGVAIVYLLQLLILPDISTELELVHVPVLRHHPQGMPEQQKKDQPQQRMHKGFPLKAQELRAAANDAGDAKRRDTRRRGGKVSQTVEPTVKHGHLFGDLEAAHRAIMEDSDESEHVTASQEKHVTLMRGNQTINAKKVLLVTYMRGGSTFLGEIFNQNPDAFIWFEPLDSVYSSIYGSNYGWHPPDIFFDDQLNLRDIPEYETEGIISATNNIFSCHISDLPTQVPTHSFFHFIQTVINNKDYQRCIKGKNSWKCVSPFAKKLCPTRTFISPESSESPKGLTLPECHELMEDIKQNNVLNTYMDKIYSRSRVYSAKRKDEVFEELFSTMNNFTQCMDEVKMKGVTCYPQLEKYCNTSSIRVVKTIRLRMRTAKQMLDRDGDMMAVVMFRDPRGVIASRFKAHFVSTNSKRSKFREAEMLCKRMAEDYRVYSDLLVRSTYDDRVIMLKYENVAQDPLSAAKRVYWNLLHTNVPDEVHTWLNSSISGDLDNGTMGTVRKNGTMTANKWMHDLTAEEIKQITEICKPVLQKLRYPIDL